MLNFDKKDGDSEQHVEDWPSTIFQQVRMYTVSIEVIQRPEQEALMRPINLF